MNDLPPPCPPEPAALPDKDALLAVLRERLAAALSALTASQKLVQDGAVHSEAKQEHPKDTRAIEAGYLARGLAERAEQLRDDLIAVERLRLPEPGSTAAVGSLVRIEAESGEETLVLLAPAGAGERLTVGGCSVLVLTPRSRSARPWSRDAKATPSTWPCRAAACAPTWYWCAESPSRRAGAFASPSRSPSAMLSA